MSELYLTKYEFARIIGQRAEQISRGAPINVKYDGMYDFLEIAEKEFREGMMPLIICRTYPDGTVKKIKVCEMKYDW
jgi:DNA-directed RNA polymerase I, II, and III subunit RPABC2